MPRVPRLGPVGTAFALWDVWRRLTPQQRKWLLAQARTHGPRLAQQAMDAQKNKRKKR
ncbi:MAG TPA: hypothetical protein VH210_02360 [Gaiellaceae bacterium]|jgi:hypothetical protein|nr:hypothetical protein [Gaiellaceae bacterium]